MVLQIVEKSGRYLWAAFEVFVIFTVPLTSTHTQKIHHHKQHFQQVVG